MCQRHSADGRWRRSAALLGGQALGPTFGGLLAALGTWRTSQAIAGVLAAALAVLIVVRSRSRASLVGLRKPAGGATPSRSSGPALAAGVFERFGQEPAALLVAGLLAATAIAAACGLPETLTPPPLATGGPAGRPGTPGVSGSPPASPLWQAVRAHVAMPLSRA